MKITAVQELLADRILVRCDAYDKTKQETRSDFHVAEINDQWWLVHNETQARRIGPYKTEEQAKLRLKMMDARGDAALPNKKWNVICTITHPTRMESNNTKKLRFNSDTSVIAPTESEAKTKAVKYFTDKGYSNVVAVSVMDLG